MATYEDLVNEVSLKLAGFTMRQDSSTHLETAVNSTELLFKIASSDNIAKGLIEVGEELVWIDTFDRASNSLTASPYGRGFHGSLATSHAVNERVTVAPTFPRQAIKTAINETIMAVYPDLYGVGSTTFTYTPAINTYALPSEADAILSVSYQTIGPSKEWLPVRNWRMDTSADTGEFNSTSSLTIYSYVDAGRNVKVVYSRQPATLEIASDDFAAVTGLTESVKDVIVLGAAHRLLSFIDPGRLNFSSPEADVQTGRVAFGSGTNTARYVYALYTQRLTDEVRRLKKRYPVRVHYTR